ncbi:DoxX family protein [Streptomyces noursei]|uniref:DoxX family protein n=1 Tax=Streptomyces noursei TaxID=1971 RepID=UPI0023B8475E|nr:DoxX family protein [Streptomyces noursei]
MNAAYWTVAGLLALFYLHAGRLKALRSRERLRPMMAWVDDIPMPAVRALGLLEVLGATGLLLPPLTGTAPWLCLAAAAGFVVLQLAATRVHLVRGDRRIALNLTLLLAAATTGWLATTWL